MYPFVFFTLLNFCVSFFSDIVLNDLNIPSLEPYFRNQSIIKCAFDAGITVVVGVLITMFFSYYLFGFVVPTRLKQLMYFCILAFLIGCILDIFIYKLNVFGNRLDNYYKTYGAGLLGGGAFVFSILISYFLQKHISIKL